MPSEFVCRIECDLAIPDFMDASVPLAQLGEEIKNDIQQNIRMQRGLDGASFPALERKTISRKGFSAALIEKGILLGAIHAYKPYRNTAIVGVIGRGKPKRDYVAGILQEEGVRTKKGRIKKWIFFGISSKMKKEINARMERWFRERAQKAAKKFINLKY
jgi:hypothetical protein